MSKESCKILLKKVSKILLKEVFCTTGKAGAVLKTGPFLKKKSGLPTRIKVNGLPERLSILKFLKFSSEFSKI